MAATRPSIMSEGATMSAPARARETAISARSGRLWSLSTSPLEMTPQWPWSVYSQRQTSATSCSSGTASLMAPERLLDDAVGGRGRCCPGHPSGRGCRRG